MPSKKKSNETPHTSQMAFPDLLAQFVGRGDSLGMGLDYKDRDMSISSRMLANQEKYSSKKKPSQSKGNYDGLDMGETEIADLDSVSDLLPEDTLDDDYDPQFDELIAKAFHEDEDVQFRNSLISMGRQYAIKGMEESTEASEVTRAFTKQEQQIGMLIDELNTDALAVQKDIEMLRMMRSKSYKSMADLISTKVAMSNAKLAAIKELSAIQKTKYDINLKLKAAKNGEGADGGFAANQAIQKLLSVGRRNLIASNDDEEYDVVGGDEAGDASFDDGRPETRIELAKDLPPAESDGDKFIQYEADGVEYVLDIDKESDTRQIYAVNRDGDVIPDYPMPSNPDQLSFTLNEMAGEATDQLQRRYRIRYNGQDIGDSANRKNDEESFGF